MNYLKRYLVCNLLISMITMPLIPQKYEQLIASSRELYCNVSGELVETSTTSFEIRFYVDWVNENLEKIQEEKARVVLKKENLEIIPADKVTCTTFSSSDFITFNREYTIKFRISEDIKIHEIYIMPDFILAGQEITNKEMAETGHIIKSPNVLKIAHHVNLKKLESLKNTPPSLTLISPRVNKGEKALIKEDRVIVHGRASDESGINLVLVNSEDAEMGTNGLFRSTVELTPGENRIKILVIDNEGSITEEEIKVECQSYAVSSEILKTGKYYALLIAVEEYHDPKINDLTYAIEDANRLYKVLTAYYTFEKQNVRMLMNPTREEIVIQLDKLIDEIGPEDNLLIFYAGHGIWSEKAGVGYWLPSDARQSNTANWFRNSALRDYIGSINSKHTLLIADACFSGSIFKSRRAFSNATLAIEKLYNLPSRKAMTSGTLSEVPDRSVFLEYFHKRLIENAKPFLTAEELFFSFKTAVINNSPNIPQFGEILNTGDEGGDFIFIRKNPE